MHPSIDRTWLDTVTPVTLDQLAIASGMNAGELDELVDYGALTPVESAPPQRMFSAACVVPLRTACRMRSDFDLDLFSMALLYGMLARIEALERQVKSLQARLPAHLHSQHEGPQPWHEPHAGMRGPH